MTSDAVADRPVVVASTAMEQGLQCLLDVEAVRAITARYGDAVAHLDAGRAALLYTDDGVASIAGIDIVGRAAIETGMRKTFAHFSLLQLAQHGGVIDIDGDQASARWSTIEISVRKGASDMTVIFGRYEDRLVREAAEWRFRHRIFTLVGRGQMTASKLRIE